MKRQVLGFAIGAAVSFVVAREIARRKRWGSEFSPRTTLAQYRAAVAQALRSLPDPPSVQWFATYKDRPHRIKDWDAAAGTMTFEVPA